VQGGETAFAGTVAVMTQQLEELQSQQALNFTTPSGEVASFNDAGSINLMPLADGNQENKSFQKERERFTRPEPGSVQTSKDAATFLNDLREKLRVETNPDRRADIQGAIDNVIDRYQRGDSADSARVGEPGSLTPTTKSSATPGSAGEAPTKSSSNSNPALMELSTAFRARILGELTQAQNDLNAGRGDRAQLSKLVGKLREDLDVVTSFVNSLPGQGSTDPDSTSKP
jgi:hypothetical protein